MYVGEEDRLGFNMRAFGYWKRISQLWVRAIRGMELSWSQGNCETGNGRAYVATVMDPTVFKCFLIFLEETFHYNIQGILKDKKRRK